MTIQRQTKRFAELTAVNFEYNGTIYHTTHKPFQARNEDTKELVIFHENTLVTELQIKMN